MTSKAASRPGETYELIGQDLGWNTRGRAGVSITFQDGDFQIQPFAHLGFETQSEQKQDELLASTLSGLLGSTRVSISLGAMIPVRDHVHVLML